MCAVAIDNPVLNSPFIEPTRHFRFTEDGITNEVVGERRISTYFVPIPREKKKGGKQLAFDTEWTQDRIKENEFINRVRQRVDLWRKGGYIGVTPITRQLLDYWNAPERDRKLFFCQIEALETAIYIAEVAGKYDPWIENDLKRFNAEANPLLYRIAFKMATGSGKTVVMAMLIAWQSLNKIHNKQDSRFSDTFLIVTPGITIRDRLRVLYPNEPDNYYRERDILPPEHRATLQQATIIITNFHTFKQRSKGDASPLTKKILNSGRSGAFVESPDEMVRRVCREMGNKKNIVVINDEAHHCYRHKLTDEDEALKGEDRQEAEKREEAARVWISGLEAVKAKMGVRAIYDLSATPFFLRGSGYEEGTLFPWVVSDFSLIDAIESGIVKVPRVPVGDNTAGEFGPVNRNLWLYIRDKLPKKGRGTDAIGGAPQLPGQLQSALQSLYTNYEQTYRQWEKDREAQARGDTPPVFIVVCNNTNVSKMVYDWIGGWERTLPDNGVVVRGVGNLPIFSNVDDYQQWRPIPNTILIDSEQLESGDAMSSDFKQAAAIQIEEFKADYRRRFPGRSTDDLTDEDLLREVMNTVGKPGKLGEQVKCVVSVSMLTEGWDANTVTHILGIRAFSTQLLCEQVVGRALRRMSYAADEDSMFAPEYAEVYGVPFSFIPSQGVTARPVGLKKPTRVRAMEERSACEITFPRVVGYRYDLPTEHLRINGAFSPEARMSLDTRSIPTRTENAPIVGRTETITLGELEKRRLAEVAFLLAKTTLEKYFRHDGISSDTPAMDSHQFAGDVKPWLFPSLLAIAKRWIAECVTCKDDAFPQLLMLPENAYHAADRIFQSIMVSTEGEKRLLPILRPYDAVGSTRYVDFNTTKPTYATDPAKCHLSHVVADTESWEQKMAQTLEEMPEVICYVKNQGLGFTIPYTYEGQEHQYIPDYIVRFDDGNPEPLNLIVEVSGENLSQKTAKVNAAHALWIPAINNLGTFGRWAYLNVTDPWEAKNAIRGMVRSASVA